MFKEITEMLNELEDVFINSDNKYLVGMSGSGSVGKTSMANAIISRLDRSKLIGSTARSTFQRLGLKNEAQQRNMTPLQKWELQQEIQLDYVRNFCKVVKELAIDTDHDILVFDRTLADHAAYCIYQCNEGLYDSDYKGLTTIINTQLNHFTDIIYLKYPPSFEVEADGFRDIDIYKDTVVDALIFKSIADSPNIIVANDGNAKGRVADYFSRSKLPTSMLI